jgi:putative cell wall-binding protein/Leucine-rich repeat (LRR) protein
MEDWQNQADSLSNADARTNSEEAKIINRPWGRIISIWVLLCLTFLPLALEATRLEAASQSADWITPADLQIEKLDGDPWGLGRKEAASGSVSVASEFPVFLEVEPNNSRTQANQLGSGNLPAEFAIVGGINTIPADEDFYRLQIGTEGALWLEGYWMDYYFEAGLEGDLYMTLYDSDGLQIADGILDGIGADMYRYIFKYVPAGTYYLKVAASQASGYAYVNERYWIYSYSFPKVNIPDPNLRIALENKLKTHGRGITTYDMYFLEDLDISYANVSSLSGLEHAPNLTELMALGNRITNLTPLKDLVNMECLDFSENPGLVNVSYLVDLTKLSDLRLNYTAVADISMLSTLSELVRIEVANTQVGNAAVLSHYPNLQVVALGSDWLKDLSVLAGRTGITNLHIYNAPLIHDLAPLSSLTNLEYLVISGTLVTDISPITGLPALWALILSNNRISDISPLSGWASGLVDLDLSHNEIQDLGPIVDFQKNGALSENSVVDVRYNDLDLSPGGQGLDDIAYLESQVVTVLYEPQKRVDRIAGANRYRTAIGVSRSGWLEGAETVILARGDSFADALAGVPLAYLLDAPILLTAPSQLSSVVLSEIQRLGAKEIIILGGTGAVSAGVESSLVAAGLTVERLAGTSRYDTAVKIAEAMQAAGADFSSAFMAVGSNFPDALAAAAYAAINGQPILLTASTYLPPATESALTALGIQDVLLVGGLGVINADVEANLSEMVVTDRIFGTNRYETALALTERFAPDADHYYIATGIDFPDAITGAVLAAKKGTGVILVYGTGTSPNKVVSDYLAGKTIGKIGLFGGASVISTSIENWFWSYTE